MKIQKKKCVNKLKHSMINSLTFTKIAFPLEIHGRLLIIHNECERNYVCKTIIGKASTVELIHALMREILDLMCNVHAYD